MNEAQQGGDGLQAMLPQSIEEGSLKRRGM